MTKIADARDVALRRRRPKLRTRKPHKHKFYLINQDAKPHHLQKKR